MIPPDPTTNNFCQVLHSAAPSYNSFFSIYIIKIWCYEERL